MKTIVLVSLALIACCSVAVHGRLLDKNFFNDLQKDSEDDTEINELTIHHRDNTEYCLFNSKASLCVDVPNRDLTKDTEPGKARNETNWLYQYSAGQTAKQLQQQQQQQQKNELDDVADQHNRQKRSFGAWLSCIGMIGVCALTSPIGVVTVPCFSRAVASCVALQMVEVLMDGQTERVGYAKEEEFKFVKSNTLLIVVPNSQLTQCRGRRKRAVTKKFEDKHIVTSANKWNMLERREFTEFVNSLDEDLRNLIRSRRINTFINLVDQGQRDRFNERSNNVPCALPDINGQPNPNNPDPTDMGEYQVITFEQRGEGYRFVENRSGCLHVFVQAGFGAQNTNWVNHLTRVSPDIARGLAALACSRTSRG